MKAWHFVGETLRDGRPIPADGELLCFDGEPILCKQGLHASLDPFDALQYAPGDTLCLVECGGIVLHQPDKLVCTKRTIIARMDAEIMLRYFARMQALSVVHLWNAPNVVLDYLMTGRPAIRADAARAAARAAAWTAARAAADAARAAAAGAARADAADAARAATRTAARVAWVAAWVAAADAARAAVPRKEFNALVHECFSDYLDEVTE